MEKQKTDRVVCFFVFGNPFCNYTSMDLPIAPSFFRRIDVYQRLIEAEREKLTKDIWEAEKEVLRWAAGPDHKLIGSKISSDHVKDILGKSFEESMVHGNIDKAKNSINYASFCSNVLEALALRGFAVLEDSAARISPEGFTAGKILIETEDLKKPDRYRVWILLWWLIFALAALALVQQVTPSLLALWNILSHIFQTWLAFIIRPFL